MHSIQGDELGEVLNHVRSWPPAKRLALAQTILETLSRDLGDRGVPRRPLKDLLGLLQVEGPVPSDEQCAVILEEERLRKHSR